MFTRQSKVLAAIRNAAFELLRHPSYSPEMTPTDFHLFPKLKKFTQECKFTNVEDIICVKNGWLEKKDQQFFYNGTRALEKRRTKCILVAGDYVQT